MAKLTLNFISEALYRPVPIDIIVPTDHMVMADQPLPEANKPYRTVYYLEGLEGNYSGPANYTKLQAYAEDYNVAVVVAGGENKWYTDSPFSGDYFVRFICKDLIRFTRRLLNISDKREDTAIMGFSMGGHGAMTIGLANPDLFGSILTIDAAYHQQVWLDAPEVPTWDLTTRKQYMTMLGVDKMEDFLGGQYDLEASAKKTIKGDLVPRIFCACGTKDGLYGGNKETAEMLKGLGYDVTWKDVEGGGHSNWTIDHALEDAFAWFNGADTFCGNLRFSGKDADLNAANFATWKTWYSVEAGDTSEYRMLPFTEYAKKN